MNNQNLIDHIRTGIDTVFQIAGEHVEKGSETDSEFSLSLSLDPVSLEYTLSQLTPFADIFAISIEYRIQQGKGTASLKTTGLIAEDWSEDPELSPPRLGLESNRNLQ